MAPPDGGDNTFTVVRVAHRAYNNLHADLQSQLEARLGALARPDSVEDAQPEPPLPPASPHAPHGPRPLYRNRLDALPHHRPYRPLRSDAQGAPVRPKPRLSGQQTALVVGPPGAVIHTDRDHRIKVQFHWQRNRKDQRGSHSRLTHPHADRGDHTGAPADHTAGTWVRLAATLAPVAGANWGGHAIPRIGQEVFIRRARCPSAVGAGMRRNRDFAEGDIDRPVVRGSAYNGQGARDAQYNQARQGAGSATGNAPAWWPGEQGAAAHPAVLSGLKTQALGHSQTGGGAYNQLVFDDSPGQGRTALQHHAQAHHGSAELNLGALRHSADNALHSVQQHPVGVGAELKTPHSVALRAAQGLLLSSNARPGARGNQLDSREAQAQLEASHHLQTRLATTAQQHHATLQGDPTPDKLPALAQTQHSLDVIQATAAGHEGSHALCILDCRME